MAAELYRSSEKSIPKMAEEPGIACESLRRWIRQYEVDAGEREGLTTEQREELSRFRREVRVLKQERDFLKKAAVGSTGRCNTAGFRCCPDRGAGVARLGRPGGLSKAGKQELWERWRAGESISHIARALQKPPGPIRGMLEAPGGISPPERRRRRRVLTLAERDEISRGLASGESLRAIAARLGRSGPAVCREVNRNGGSRRYRAAEAEERALKALPASEKVPACDERAPAGYGGKEATGGLVTRADLWLAQERVS